MQTRPFISRSNRLTITMMPTRKAVPFFCAALFYALCFFVPAHAAVQPANTKTSIKTAGEDDNYDTGKYQNQAGRADRTCGEPLQAQNKGESDPGNASTKNRGMYGPCPPKGTAVPYPQQVYLNPKTKKPEGRKLDDWHPTVWAGPLKNKKTGGQGGGGGAGGGQEEKRDWQDPAYVRGGDYSQIAAWSWVPDESDTFNGSGATSGDNTAYKTGGTVPRINGCYDMLDFGQKPQNDKDKAFANYLRAIQCSQQYILSAAADADKDTWRQGQRMLCNTDESKPGTPCRMPDEIQRVTMQKDAKAEYKPGFYLACAARKTLIDPSKGCDGGPRPTGTAMRLDGNMFAQARNFIASDANAAADVDAPYEAFNGWPEPIKLKNTDKYRDLPAKLEKIRDINQFMKPCDKGDNKGCEVILDVTDPFSPRSDVPACDGKCCPKSQPANDRDEYSCRGKIYSQFEKDNVVCASNPTKNREGKAPGAVGDDKIVKVDLMGSRKDSSRFPDRFPLFDREIQKRIKLNVKCWNDQLGTICWRKPFCVTHVPCWRCFFGTQKKTGTVKEGFRSPPCSTDHYNGDRQILRIFCPNFGNRNVAKIGNGYLRCKYWESAPSLCAKLRAPLQMLNSAKIRRYDPSDQKNNRFPVAIGEGSDVASKYGCRMPYMVQRDTGTTVGAKSKTGQDPWDYNGCLATAVGSGVVHVPQGGGNAWRNSEPNETRLAFWQRFGLVSDAMAQGAGLGSVFNAINKVNLNGIGGGLGIGSQNGAKFQRMGMTFGNGFKRQMATTSFSNTLMDQAFSIRNFGMNGVPDALKMGAPGTATSKVSFAAGGQIPRRICSECDDKGNCTPCGAGGGGGGGAAGGGQKRKFYSYRYHNWPLSYRGQPCTKGIFDEDKKKPLKERQCFPFVGAKKEPTLHTGLDEARPGCIALLFNGGSKIEESDTPGKMFTPTLGYIRSIHTTKNTTNSKTAKPCTDMKNCHVIMEAANDGFFPTGLGFTTHWGFLGRRTIYKPGNLPESVSKKNKEITQANQRDEPTDTCQEPQFGACSYESWDQVPIYCPDEDVREEQ